MESNKSYGIAVQLTISRGNCIGPSKIRIYINPVFRSCRNCPSRAALRENRLGNQMVTSIIGE